MPLAAEDAPTNSPDDLAYLQQAKAEGRFASSTDAQSFWEAEQMLPPERRGDLALVWRIAARLTAKRRHQEQDRARLRELEQARWRAISEGGAPALDWLEMTELRYDNGGDGRQAKAATNRARRAGAAA